MPEHVFNPEVTEPEWLGLSPCDVWAVWRSMPRPAGLEEWQHTRKERLIVADLMRLIVDQMADPRSRAVVEVGERYADGLIPDEAYWAAHEAAYAASDAVRHRTRAAGDAALVAEKYLYSLDDALRLLPGAVESRTVLLARRAKTSTRGAAREAEQIVAARLRQVILDVFGNPFRPVAFDSGWRTEQVVALARTMYEARDFGPMPVLADALQDAGCADADLLAHCRDPQQVHVRGCWVVDLVLGKA